MIFDDMTISELILVVLVAIGVSIFVFISSPPKSNVVIEEPKPDHNLVSMVKAELKNKNATLYGASWCGYTVKQLNEIGGRDAVNYVDCAEEAHKETCTSEGIEAYPTWKINGQMYPGYYSVETLSQMLR